MRVIMRAHCCRRQEGNGEGVVSFSCHCQGESEHESDGRGV